MVKHFISQYHLSFIALLETKISDRKLAIVVKKIASNWNCFSNTSYAGKIGIMILWDPNILDINIVNSSAQQITFIDNEEKLGGSLLTDTDFKDFRDFIQDSLLNHLKSIGCFYTWNNKQNAISKIWCRLDRALVNDTWLHNFNSSQVEFLPPNPSDHSPALISILEDEIQGFKMYSIYTKLKNLRGVLKDMNNRHFYNISEQVLRAKKKLEEVQQCLQLNPFMQSLIIKERDCLTSYNRLLECEMSFLHQKARID
ncbi:uncharacterized protein LOC109830741 [Asparagus officinalis]|uniref:uncharacterized protein LOC109830741 n=1 Tax=Asparagus officinalis TaxID=4686 RepID=UPI00098E8221|nr:uncharacterized protein LOC109830741 [Asparagus officinalis]